MSKFHHSSLKEHHIKNVTLAKKCLICDDFKYKKCQRLTSICSYKIIIDGLNLWRSLIVLEVLKPGQQHKASQSLWCGQTSETVVTLDICCHELNTHALLEWSIVAWLTLPLTCWPWHNGAHVSVKCHGDGDCRGSNLVKMPTWSHLPAHFLWLYYVVISFAWPILQAGYKSIK